MQGNTTEIDERNLLRLDALLSHGYGLSPQLVMRSKGLSIEAKALYGYLSSFAGAGDTAFPSTSRILEELDISKKEQIGHRKFFNPSSQLNVNAANDAAVFNEILNEKMRQGVSNIRRKMYITFSVSAPTVDDAVPKLARIENQISQILTSIGSKSHVLDGAERLALLNSQLNPLKPFNFDYRRDISARMVQTTKDCIAPMTLDFKPEGLADCFKTGDMWGQVLVIKKLGSELTDQALSDITELPIPLNVTWFAQPMDKAAAVAFTRQRLAWIDKEIIEEQRSAVQKGYDFSILPQELKYSKEETEDVIDNLQNKNQRLYVFTGLFYTYAPTKKQLDNQVLSIISAARQNSIEVSTYEYRQRQGFNSILPLGHNHCEISRMSTTAEVSILMPFATMELDDKGGNYYGQNKHSSNLIFCNRKLLASPMGFVCGKTGTPYERNASPRPFNPRRIEAVRGLDR